MSSQRLPSQLIERAVEQFSTLPGIGRKTALRLCLHLLSRSGEETHAFTEALNRLRDEIIYCRHCHNISDTEICSICAASNRDRQTLCVVQTVSDVLAIEATVQYHGLYHVLGGVISPMDGVGPSDLTIDALVERIPQENIREVILALGSTMEGDTTNFFLYRKLAPTGVKISVIARGIAIGDEIEYADELTLGRSIINRTDFEQSVKI